jgi:RNA-directed DNA polymerase
MLDRLRGDLKAGRFVPELVWEKVIPKTSGEFRRLGIPTTVHRVVQAASKLVLEHDLRGGLQAMFLCLRPRRRAQDAIAEIPLLASPTGNYEWVFEADIKACFYEIGETALLGRVPHSVGTNGFWVGEGALVGRDPH